MTKAMKMISVALMQKLNKFLEIHTKQSVLLTTLGLKMLGKVQ
ncbi:hypothetical protein EDB47_11896 [Vibrio crassostreae]|nr:hypothetical protein EDB47_11896 [Vibrio crassostreae]